MARQDINIGIEGNDNTGDSIRESFRKTNENFSEIYAIFGAGGKISLTALSDTPDSYANIAGQVLGVRQDELGVEALEFVSGSALSGDPADDTVNFDYSEEGKIVVTTQNNRVSDDNSPTLNGPLNANGNGIANVEVSEAAALAHANRYANDTTINDLVIDKKYGDSNYLARETAGKSANLRSEPESALEYDFIATDFSTSSVFIFEHGLTKSSDTAPYVFRSTGIPPTNLVDGNTYYIRVQDSNNIELYENEADAITGTVPMYFTSNGSGTHTLTDAAYDSSLQGYWLDNEALPRESVVRRQGDDMTGALTLHDHPGAVAGQGIVNGDDDLQAATKYYVDSQSFASNINLFVSNKGDDKQTNTPVDAQGRSLAYAFKSVKAACRRAEELVESSPFEPGPYMQTITHSDGTENSTITNVGFTSIIAGRPSVRDLLNLNKEFIQTEVIAYIADQYPDLDYDTALCFRDIGYIIDSIVLDVQTGTNANYLSRWAGMRYYTSPSARKAITVQHDETVAAILKAQSLALAVLNNTPVTVLQTDVPQVIDEAYDVSGPAATSVVEKFDIIIDVINDGVLNAPKIVDGNLYRLVFTNGNLGNVDQGVSTNTDILPGKVVRGKESGAVGKIINYVRETDSTLDEESENDIIDLVLLEPTLFIEGEALEYGNLIRKAQVTIKIESGIFYEDYPIRIPTNVSLSGDDMRRTIIRPNNRTSQSPWADVYFYRDKQFDNLTGDETSITGIADPNLPTNGTAYVNPLTDEIDGYFGYHYLVDPTRVLNIGNFGLNNPGLFNNAAALLTANKEFIVEEVIAYIDTTYVPSGFDYNKTKCRRDTGYIVNGLISDLIESGREQTLANQGAYYSGAVEGQETETIAAIGYIKTIAENVLENDSNNPFTSISDVDQEFDSSITSESAALSNLESLVDCILYAFNENYNPPKSNMGVDAFMMNDATRIGDLTVQGHGGFMVVLDPEGQILTKSPYIQVGSSFSQSINRQAFRGGMFIDAYTGNVPMEVYEKIDDSAFNLLVRSNENEGLFYRKPQVPCPFYIDGNRFQVNMVRNWDPIEGTAELILDASSNNGTGFDGITSTASTGRDLTNPSDASPVAITAQTAGYRSMLGNDFTQINDLGYGLVVANGGLSEMVSMFTYYCWAAFYSYNGSEIRSLNGSNAYGEYGLVAEGSDPNEIPDAVILRDDMTQPFKTAEAQNVLDFASNIVVSAGETITQDVTLATGTVVFDTVGKRVYLTGITGVFTTNESVTASITGVLGTPSAVDTPGYTNAIGQLSLYGYDLDHEMQNSGELEILHTSSSTLSRYEVTNVTKLTGFIVDGYITPAAASSTSIGNGFLFNVGKSLIRGYTVYITNSGFNYEVGDEFLVVGDQLGGTATTHDLIITVTEVSTNGSITSISTSGTISPNDSTPSLSGQMYKFNFSQGSSGFSEDGLEENTSAGVIGSLRQNQSFVFSDIADDSELVTRPSTAVIFEDDPDNTYRTIAFGGTESTGTALDSGSILATTDSTYDYVRVIVNKTYISETEFAGAGTTTGHTVGDTVIAIEPLTDITDISRLGTGVMIFSWGGKTHQIDSYDYTSGDEYARITISDVANSDINQPATSEGIAVSFVDTTNDVTIRAGLPAGSDAAITVNISTCRATGHDFLDIGTGGFNTSNYPNVLLGSPREPKQPNEVQERNKGRVFYVSTDQDGFFRVGKFFTVDQGTGTVTFSASIALSNLDGIGFKRGVVVSEFSTDTGMTNNAADTVPVQSAVRGYVNRRLGFDHNGDAVGNRIGAGVLATNGTIPMTGDLNAASNTITNLKAPNSDSDVSTKGYVDGVISSNNTIGENRDVEINNIDGNQLLITTGKKRVYIKSSSITEGVFAIGDNFTANVNGGTGTIVDIEVFEDSVEGESHIITYTDTSTGINYISTADRLEVAGGARGQVVVGPLDEWANGINDANSDISITVNRTDDNTTVDYKIKDNIIINSDVKFDAAIEQSKLDMQAATTRENATGISQSDLGLVSFDSDDFSVTDGWVTLKSGDVDFDDLLRIEQNTILGRTDAGTGLVSPIPLTTSGIADSIVRTQSDGSIRVNSLKLGGSDSYNILSLSGTELFFKTPGQATILSAQGTDTNMIIDVPGSVRIGTTSASESVLQNNSSFNTQSKLGVDWIYSSFIEAPGEKTAASTGVAIGANTGKSSAGQVAIVTANGTTASVVPSIFTKDGMIPDTTNQYNVGSATRLYATMYATSFNGLATHASALKIGTTTYTAATGATNNSAVVRDASGDITANEFKGNATTCTTASNANLLDNYDSSKTAGANTVAVRDASGNLTANQFLGNATTCTTATTALNANQLDNYDSSKIATANTVAVRDASGNLTANIFNGTATAARYADLAEMYLADAQYEPGTVLVLGGEFEVTLTNTKGDHRIAGVVSTNPAHLMNSDLEGEFKVELALQGRVPVKVLGRVKKGDLLVTSAIPGYAAVNNTPQVGTIIGKAITDKNDDTKGIVEVLVGRV